MEDFLEIKDDNENRKNKWNWEINQMEVGNEQLQKIISLSCKSIHSQNVQTV